jgi:hypothetical protein
MNPTTSLPSFDTVLADLLAKLNKAYEIYWTRSGFTHSKVPQIRVSSRGTRFLKLSQFDEVNGIYQERSVHSFVELATGNVFKAATFKAPVTTGKTKGVRTNIFSPDVLNHITVHGVSYLRGGCFDTVHNELAKAGS